MCVDVYVHERVLMCARVGGREGEFNIKRAIEFTKNTEKLCLSGFAYPGAP